MNAFLTLDEIADALKLPPRVVRRAADAMRFETEGTGPDRSAWLESVRDVLERDKENCIEDPEESEP